LRAAAIILLRAGVTVISIGAVFLGPELEGSNADRQITAIMEAASECTGSDRVDVGPGINVVYYVEGSLDSPDWEGARDGKFSRKRQLLMVQVAVPSRVVNPRALRQRLLDGLDNANDLAFQFFRRKGLSYPLARGKALAQQIRKRVEAG
jgi:hypothetical protein